MERITLGRITLATVLAFSLSHINASAQANGLPQIQEGHRLLDQGDYPAAIQRFNEARERYQLAKDPAGVQGSYVSESQALLRSGQPINACWMLLKVLSFDADVCLSREGFVSLEPKVRQSFAKQPQTKVQMTALQNMGAVSQKLGKTEQALFFYQAAMAVAEQLNQPDAQNSLRLDLSNAKYAQFLDKRNVWVLSTGQKESDQLARDTLLFDAKESAADFSDSLLQLSSMSQRDLALRARLNWIAYFQTLQQWEQASQSSPDLKQLLDLEQQHFEVQLKEAITADYSQLPPIEAVQGRLKLAKALLQVHENSQQIGLPDHPLTHAYRLSQASYDQAQDFKNDRALSYAAGTLGQIYRATGQQALAEQALSKAQKLAIANYLPEASYRWDRELGELYTDLGQEEKALLAYESSINALDDVRSGQLGIRGALQSSFQEDLQPVYHSYMKLLLEMPNPNLEKVLAINERLEIVALENFLECGRLIEFTSLKDLQAPTTFHFLDLGERLDVIVRSGQTLERYSADAKSVREAVATMQTLFEEDDFSEEDTSGFLPLLQTLYQELIQPGEHLIGSDKTFLHVSNGPLQSLPLAMLHDGEQYLASKYAIASSLGSQIPSSPATSRSQPLFFGIRLFSPSMDGRDLDALPEVEYEAAGIQRATGAKVFLDDSFTKQKLRSQLAKQKQPILHIATHGRFSSNPEETFLLAWNDPLKVEDLDEIVRGQTGNGESGIDLLFLSACESAKGDQAATLGLSGIATQAGARSTISSFWLVDSGAASALSIEFYRALSSGQTKAESLRQAQQKLLASGDYSHPYYWAPFILIGNWL